MADLATPTTASAQSRSLLAQATDAWADEALGHLQRLVRMRTVNPPGDEAQAIEYVAGVLRAAGLEPRIFEVAPGRSNLVCRIAGRGPGGPQLLASHADVVEAEAESWRYDPFGGEIADGCLWGRGTIDMKGKTAMDLAVMLAFARSGVRRMIHGHTHRPADHRLDTAGGPCERIVLADWRPERIEWLEVSPAGVFRRLLS